MRKLRPLLLVALTLIPLTINAATVEDIFDAFGSFFLEAITFLIAVATAVFMWGIIR